MSRIKKGIMRQRSLKSLVQMPGPLHHLLVSITWASPLLSQDFHLLDCALKRLKFLSHSFENQVKERWMKACCESQWAQLRKPRLPLLLLALLLLLRNKILKSPWAERFRRLLTSIWKEHENGVQENHNYICINTLLFKYFPWNFHFLVVHLLYNFIECL